jgi:hypothetical protein
MVAQQRATPAADPMSGTWTGDWGPNAGDRNMVSVALTKSTYTASTGAVHMEAETKSPRDGSAVHYVIDGKLTNGSMAGSWNHDASKGDFKLTKK